VYARELVVVGLCDFVTVRHGEDGTLVPVVVLCSVVTCHGPRHNKRILWPVPLPAMVAPRDVCPERHTMSPGHTQRHADNKRLNRARVELDYRSYRLYLISMCLRIHQSTQTTSITTVTSVTIWLKSWPRCFVRPMRLPPSVFEFEQLGRHLVGSRPATEFSTNTALENDGTYQGSP
jgi:hypothetical protein